MARTYVYTRASTKKQDRSPEEQYVRCAEHALQLATIPAASTDAAYMDAAVSGTIPFIERPAGRALLLAIERGDYLIVDALDRVGRDYIDQILTIQLLFKRGVFVHCLDLLILAMLDPEDPQAEDLLMQMAAQSHRERRKIGERTRRAIHARRALGFHPGFGKPLGKAVLPNPAVKPEMSREQVKSVGGRSLLVDDVAEQEFFKLAYERWLAGENIKTIQRKYKNTPGCITSYWRLRRAILQEQERRMKEAARIERQRVFSGRAAV